MPERDAAAAATSLEAKSPFELRVNLGKRRAGDGRPRRRSPPATWASCTRSPPARPSTARASASSPGRPAAVALPLLPQPRHLDDDQRHPGARCERATEELRKYRHGLKVMSGGFTLSGGEPLMQHRFAVQAVRRARRRWASTPRSTPTATTATASPTRSSTRSTWCCSTSRRGTPSGTRALTGMDIGPTLAFARRLAARKRPIWVRFVLVPGLTDDPEDIAQDRAASPPGSATSSASTCCPFHQMGRYKWERLGLDYTLERRRAAVGRARRAGAVDIPAAKA